MTSSSPKRLPSWCRKRRCPPRGNSSCYRGTDADAAMPPTRRCTIDRMSSTKTQTQAKPEREQHGGSRLMLPMPIVDLLARGRELAQRGERVSVLWQEPQSLAFVARGREYRSEFHVNPSDEVMLMIKGDMRLHYRTPDGTEAVAVVPEGSTIYTP